MWVDIEAPEGVTEKDYQFLPSKADHFSGGKITRTFSTSKPGVYHDFFLAVLIGNLLLGIYTSFLGYIGAKTGLTTHLLARFSFGVKGSWLPSLLLGGTQVGWFGVGVAMFAIPVGKATGLDINLLIAVSGLLMTVTVFLAFRR